MEVYGTYTDQIRANNIILLCAYYIKLVRRHRLPIDRSVAFALARVCESRSLRMGVCSVHNMIIIIIKLYIYRVGKRTEAAAAEFECGPTV